MESAAAKTAGHAGAADGPALPVLPPRYQWLRVLGRGGFGEVHLVRDEQLQRDLALKVLRADIAASEATLGQFVAEARITAQLDHPGIVPVHDLGWLADGQMYYTMAPVNGQTLRQRIDAWHAGGAEPLQQLVGWLHRVCEAVAFAHDRGVVHRDLKPANVMVGAFGEILVLDWGLALPLADASERALSKRVGTPGYMAPELTTGGAASRQSDVYALGAILAAILTGAAVSERWGRDGPPDDQPPSPRAGSQRELWRICRGALAIDPQRRPADANALGQQLSDWLLGAHRRREAEALHGQATQQLASAVATRQTAMAHRAQAAQCLQATRPDDPVERKRSGWQLQDRADELDAEAAAAELAALQLLHSAMQLAPDAEPVHAALADHYWRTHQRAELDGNAAAAREAETLLRQHDRGRYGAYLAGTGALTLHTSHPAQAWLYRYEVSDRRLQPVLQQSLGPTPLTAVPLPMGSWLVVLRRPDGPDVAYPVQMDRQLHWDGMAPGSDAALPVPLPVPLPGDDELGPGVCYVPPGWFWAGDRSGAVKCLRRQRVWLGGFAIQQFPVTNGQWAAFLNDLCAHGRQDEALRCAPRERPGTSERGGAIIYGRDADGRFYPTVDADGDLWLDDSPVTMVPWDAAWVYADWLAARTGKPWRVPCELEWEKAARGVDGRLWPWGGFADPTWAHIYGSRPGRNPGPLPVDQYATDASPYGVRGMAGNTRDWCADPYSAAGVWAHDQAFLPPAALRAGDQPRVLKGGSFYSPADSCRASARQDNVQSARTADLGVRLVFSLPAAAQQAGEARHHG